MTQEQTEKGIICCSEFLCGECPYIIYEDKTKEYDLRCINKLMVDIKDLYFQERKGD